MTAETVRHANEFMRCAADEIERLTARVAALAAIKDRLRQEAEQHAMEARTMRATVHECYQAATGGTGEPGNWHGAEPIRERIAALTARAENAEAEVSRLRTARSAVLEEAATVADYYAEMDYAAMHYPEGDAIAASNVAHEIRVGIRALAGPDGSE